jgi:outer membrane receptor protein involved in Fe transport
MLKHSRRIPAFGLPLLASAACLVLPQVHAQVLEEVLVTAQKREQSLQDVPVAVSAITGEMLEQSGVKDMFDLSNNTPSLIVNSTQSSSTTSFAIRGVFTSSQNFGLESSVGLYVDGVYRARQSSMINNLVDVASVEVLRGPQGTLFGRNTPAGAVLVNSVKPDHEGTGFLELSAGDYGLLSASGAASFSAIDNVLAFRATGFTMERDGYVDLWTPGESGTRKRDDFINDRDRWGVRLQALYTPNEDLSIHVIGDHSEVDEICCGASTWKNNLQAQDLPPGSPPKLGTDTNILALGGTVMDQDDFYKYRMSSSFAPTSENEDEGVSVQIDWQLPAFLLTSITAYRSFDSSDFNDIDFADVDGAYRENVGEQTQWSQELRVSNQGDRLAYVAGLYYFSQDLDSNNEIVVGEDLGPLVGVPASLFPAGTGSITVAEQDHESYAVFGQFDYNLTESLVLTAGLRWTREQKDMTNTFTQCDLVDCSSDKLPGFGFLFFPPLSPRDDVDEDLDDDQTTGTVKLSWFMDDTTMLYASYGTGYKAGGINTDRIVQGLDVVFGAEKSESYEIGMKKDFPEQALRINVALHKTDTDDLQTISFQGSGFELQNAGVAETYGGEVDLFWNPTDNLDIVLGYAYNHAEYADFKEGDCWIGTPWHTGQPDPEDNGDGTCDRSGGDVSGNPENVLHLSANWAFDLSDGMRGFLYGEYTFTDERMTDVNNDPVKKGDSYEIVNLRAGVDFTRWDMQLTAWARNVFDEDYVTTIADTVAQEGNFISYFNETRTWGVTLRKAF